MSKKIRPIEYTNIDEFFDRAHLHNLIKWLHAEVLRSGGDGDAIWYSKFYWVNEILELVKGFNDTLSCKWDISFDEENGRIHWHLGQSSILITNNKEDFDNRPSWQQCSVVL